MGYDLCAVHALKQDALSVEERWAPENYLRRSIGGIGALREALMITGAMFDCAKFGLTPPCGWTGQFGEGTLRFPDPEDYGLSVGEDGLQGDRLAEFQAAEERVLAAHGPSDVPGIPLHKLCDNSGWLVTALECRAAVALIERWLSSQGITVQEAQNLARAVDECQEWNHLSGRDAVVYEVGDALPFLTSCARHEGFRTF